MALQLTGRLSDKKHKGWKYQIYRDDRSPTGWVRKIWDPLKPAQEFFEDYDLEADEDAAAATTAKASQTAAEKAADRQRLANRQDAADQQREAELDRSYGDKALERTSREGVASADRKARMAELERRLQNDKYEFDRQFGLDERKLGLDTLKTAASLRGPEDYFQGASFARGVSAAGLTPSLSAFANGRVPSYGGGTATTGNPTPLTINSLVNDMTGQPGAGLDAYGRPLLRPDQQQALDVISKKFEGGLANAQQGELENLTPDELKAFKSGGSYIGRNVDDEFTMWKRSRPGQRSALAA